MLAFLLRLVPMLYNGIVSDAVSDGVVIFLVPKIACMAHTKDRIEGWVHTQKAIATRSWILVRSCWSFSCVSFQHGTAAPFLMLVWKYQLFSWFSKSLKQNTCYRACVALGFRNYIRPDWIQEKTVCIAIQQQYAAFLFFRSICSGKPLDVPLFWDYWVACFDIISIWTSPQIK